MHFVGPDFAKIFKSAQRRYLCWYGSMGSKFKKRNSVENSSHCVSVHALSTLDVADLNKVDLNCQSNAVFDYIKYSQPITRGNNVRALRTSALPQSQHPRCPAKGGEIALP